MKVFSSMLRCEDLYVGATFASPVLLASELSEPEQFSKILLALKPLTSPTHLAHLPIQFTRNNHER